MAAENELDQRERSDDPIQRHVLASTGLTICSLRTEDATLLPGGTMAVVAEAREEVRNSRDTAYRHASVSSYRLVLHFIDTAQVLAAMAKRQQPHRAQLQIPGITRPAKKG